MNDQLGSGHDQLGFDLGDDASPPSYEPDREEVQAELTELLAIAKAAVDEAPWDPRTFLYHKVVFPQMAQWLPDEQRDQLCFEFAIEVRRIELLMAA